MVKAAHAVDTAELRKARGAFFTPPPLCAYLARWAIRSATDSVFEPSCGDAGFLLAAGSRLGELGCRPEEMRLHGVELHQASADAARSRLQAADYPTQGVGVGDFFDHEAAGTYSAVIGNPPYVRYQDFTGVARSKSQRLALSHGVALTGLASSWAAFTIHAASHLAADGRLGLVLPAELLTVNYAANVRSFLLERFARVRLVIFEQRVFPGVLEEVVLLLAEGSGGTDHFELYQVRDLDELPDLRAEGSRWTPGTTDAKWLSALVEPNAAAAYEDLVRCAGFAGLLTWGETSLGMVTGANHFFALTADEAAARKLDRKTELLRISPPGSKHLRTLTLTDAAWRSLAVDGKRVYLFRPATTDAKELSAGAVLWLHTEGG